MTGAERSTGTAETPRFAGADKSGTTRPTVLLVEDDDAARRRVADIIARQGALDLLAAVGTCAEARAALARRLPDVLLTDIGLPDGSGIDLIHEVRRRGTATEIMIITVFGDEKHVIAAIEAGASGYLLKDGAPEYIVESIFQLLQGGSPISAAIARHLLRRFRRAPAAERPAAVAPVLTGREQEVLEYLAKGFSISEIAAMLAVSVHTVTSHVKHIYRKLEVRSRSEAVFEAVQLGLIRLDGAGTDPRSG